LRYLVKTYENQFFILISHLVECWTILVEDYLNFGSIQPGCNYYIQIATTVSLQLIYTAEPLQYLASATVFSERLEMVFHIAIVAWF